MTLLQNAESDTLRVRTVDDVDRCAQTFEQSLNSDDREGQATKSTRWMPWHQEPMKDVALLR